MKNRTHHKVIRIADDDHLTARALASAGER
jgi:hypothetical protein